MEKIQIGLLAQTRTCCIDLFKLIYLPMFRTCYKC